MSICAVAHSSTTAYSTFSSFVGIVQSLAVTGTYVEVGVESGAWANEVGVVERRELICTSLTDALDLR